MSTDERVKPTEEEIRNGWTEESLNNYINERENAFDDHVDFALECILPWTSGNRKHNINSTTDSQYDPFKW